VDLLFPASFRNRFFHAFGQGYSFDNLAGTLQEWGAPKYGKEPNIPARRS
jgi:hypothetical protein